MAASYSTPGVYVEEIPKFPPSIAAVETAIPAFIGYTEKAAELAVDDLLNVPRRIGSIADFELYYGTDYTPTVTGIDLDGQGFFKTATFNKRFLLYNSLRLFYANGGGDCYIVSVGNYDDTPAKADFLNPNAGIQALEKYDEPTILLFPDASLLADNALYEIQAAALAQCQLLKDRVGLFDLKPGDPQGTEFRSKSGVNSLKYGMAYTPWLATSFSKGYSYRAISKDNLIQKNGVPVTLKSLTSNAALLATLLQLEQTMDDLHAVAVVSPSLYTLRADYDARRTTYQSTKTVPNFMAISAFFFEVGRKLDTLVTTPQLTNPDLLSAVKLAIGSLAPTYTQLIAYEHEAKDTITNYIPHYDVPGPASAPEWGAWSSASEAAAVPASHLIPPGLTSDPEKMDSMLGMLDAAMQQFNTLINSGILQAVAQHEKTLNDALYASFPQYKAIINGLEAAAGTLPPSGPMAGIYALVDRTRGVWKAPANVSLVGGEPTVTFTLSELERLNVDTTAGKSINVIRPFTGKGTLVYGARTLAGNDNEWRYVSVRRLFNFVEESIKKATEQFVFEPNDANTWVRVQAMMENFLTILWRQGALQGVKPEHAFYVAVGLGKTMTAFDILEGRLVVELGLAAVRPAEFIILKFSHKMAES